MKIDKDKGLVTINNRFLKYYPKLTEDIIPSELAFITIYIMAHDYCFSLLLREMNSLNLNSSFEYALELECNTRTTEIMPSYHLQPFEELQIKFLREAPISRKNWFLQCTLSFIISFGVLKMEL